MCADILEILADVKVAAMPFFKRMPLADRFEHYKK